MTRLSVNVNKIALVRNTRDGEVPSVVKLSRAALKAGAHGITVHPRPDRRHIRPDDVRRLAALLAEPAYADREYNIEGNPLQGDYLDLVAEARPDQCTLVPDTPGQRTSDHGWDLADPRAVETVKPIVAQLHGLGCRVSLFMDPEPAQIQRVPATGADRIELYTEGYAKAHAAGPAEADQSLARYAEAARAAAALGLGVNAGHDLNLDNLAPFLTRVPGVLEVSIGHALTADALAMGMPAAVAAYLDAIARAQPPA